MWTGPDELSMLLIRWVVAHPGGHLGDPLTSTMTDFPPPKIMGWMNTPEFWGESDPPSHESQP